MRFFYLKIIVCLCFCGVVVAENPALKEEIKTIVPKKDHVSEFETRLSLARIYSHEEKTAKVALQHYRWLLQQKPDDIELVIEAGHFFIKEKNIYK